MSSRRAASARQRVGRDDSLEQVRLDGAVHAFHNVCAHRGSAVELSSCVSQRRFTCPYHAWSYDTAGRLRSIPNDDGFTSVDREQHGLVPVPVEERHGLVWAVPGAAPDAAHLIYVACAGLAALGIGTLVFRRMERDLAVIL